MGAFSSTSDKGRARAVIAAIGEAVTYRGDLGTVSTIAYIDQEGEPFGADGTIGEKRWVCALLVEDVGIVQRGDRVTDADGTAWELREEIAGDDPWITDWTVQKR